MTDKTYDFKGALENLDKQIDTAKNAGFPMNDDPYVETIQYALRLAERLQSEMSGEMIAICYSEKHTYWTTGHANCNLYRELIKKLIQEVRDGE